MIPPPRLGRMKAFFSTSRKRVFKVQPQAGTAEVSSLRKGALNR